MFQHRFYLLCLAALPLLGVQPVLADVQVGTCNGVTGLATISDGVAAVSAGGNVNVCPGTYAEQVTISKPLTLQGIAAGTANQAVVTVPTAGLVQNVTSIFTEPVAAQILVLNAGPVNITNIAVDGTGGDMGCLSWLAGIFYASGSSGTVNHVRASNQIDSTCGVGIWAENGGSSSLTVAVTNSSVYNADSAGIFGGSNATPTLSITVNNNVVNVSSAVADIDVDSVTGSVSNNSIANASFGIYDLSTSAVPISSNTIIGSATGILLGSGGTATGNQISGASDGILVDFVGPTITNNTIVSSTAAGVELGCFAASVSGNSINDAPIGIDAIPAAGIGTNNTFFNTATTVTGGCAAAAVLSPHAMAKRRANAGGQWRTPATPFGTRTK